MSPDIREQEYELFKQWLHMWQQENPIKTIKLQFLLLTNALLFVGVQLNGGWHAENAPLYFVGVVVCLVWTFSIGRTMLFQKRWQARLRQLAGAHADDPRFQVLASKVVDSATPRALRLLGGLSSKYYLLGTPLLFLFWWLAALAWTAR